MKPTIAVVVDPFSSGAGYPEVFRALGVKDVYAVISHRDVFEGLWKAFKPGDFSGVITPLGDDIQSERDRLLQSLQQPGHRIIVVAGCETGVVLADWVAKILGAVGNDPETSWDRRDKYRMGLCLE